MTNHAEPTTADTREGPDAAAERFIVLLGDLMEKMLEVDSRPMDFGTGSVLHRAEIHTIQVIGRKPGTNLTTVAGALGVTKGAASQMVSRLVRKGLVFKSRSAETRREIALALTQLGWTAFHAHERLHQRMFAAVRQHYGAELSARVAQGSAAVRDLIGLVETYGRMPQD